MRTPPTSSTGEPSGVRLLLAFAAVYFIWGSTYLAIRFAIETIPPFRRHHHDRGQKGRMNHYLDFAATSAIRPPAVVEAMTRFLTDCGGTPGRGGHARAVEAGRMALRCRRALQEILGLPGDPGRIAFMQNATHAINTALWGLLEKGDAVVVTAYDHNAVLRPASYLQDARGVEVRMAGGNPNGDLDMDEVSRLLEGAKLLVVNSASNVLGNRLPIARLTDAAKATGTLVLLDVAQGAGNIPLSCGKDGADLVAFTGHKGLLGPQGVGGLWVRDGVEVAPLLRGGTGGDSSQRTMPPTMPDRLEAGSVNAPGLAGLLAGVEAVLDMGVEAVHKRELKLKKRLRDGMSAIVGVRVRSPEAPDGAPLVTLTLNECDPASVAERLEKEWGVQGRSGLHCAPEAHRVVGTLDTGALRLSLGWASTEEDVDRAVEGMSAIAGQVLPGLA